LHYFFWLNLPQKSYWRWLFQILKLSLRRSPSTCGWETLIELFKKARQFYSMYDFFLLLSCSSFCHLIESKIFTRSEFPPQKSIRIRKSSFSTTRFRWQKPSIEKNLSQIKQNQSYTRVSLSVYVLITRPTVLDLLS